LIQLLAGSANSLKASDTAHRADIAALKHRCWLPPSSPTDSGFVRLASPNRFSCNLGCAGYGARLGGVGFLFDILRGIFMKINGSAVRTGMVIEFKDKLWRVVKHEIRTPGNLHAFNQLELRDIKTGTKDNVRMGESDMVERAYIDSSKCSFLYADGDRLHFMDSENYEQFELPADMMGDQLPFLQENMEVDMETYEETPINVRLPDTIILLLTEADGVVKGQTASSSYKPAMGENGMRVMVPAYITAGEKIVVKTEDGSFVGRHKDK
jgi:elongation factor P